MSQKILLYAPNWIGDAVMAVPAAKVMKLVFPDSHLTVLGKKWVTDIFRFVPEVDALLTFTRSRRKFRQRQKELTAQIRNRRFEMAFLLPDSFSAAYLLFRTRIPHRIGYANEFRSFMLTTAIPLFEVRGWHRTDKYMYLLHAFSDTLPYGQPPQLTLGTTPDYPSLAPAWHPEKVHIGLNPQAVADSRRWPISNWIEFINSFDPARVQFLIFGGPDDTHRTAQIMAHVSGDMVDVTGKLTLQDSIRLMSGCEVFVTNDSGLMHVANAIGIPTIGFYGAADIQITGLRGNIYRNLNAGVYCSPCVRNTCLNKTEPLVCLESIPPAWPVQAVQDFIDPVILGRSV